MVVFLNSRITYFCKYIFYDMSHKIVELSGKTDDDAFMPDSLPVDR